MHARGNGEVVLVVDDEPIIRMLVVEVLAEAGYTAVEAGDGPAALKMLQSEARIELLITDVGLPGGLNGRQVADAARVARPELRVIHRLCRKRRAQQRLSRPRHVGDHQAVREGGAGAQDPRIDRGIASRRRNGAARAARLRRARGSPVNGSSPIETPT